MIGYRVSAVCFEESRNENLYRNPPPVSTQENSKMTKNGRKIGLFDTNSAAEQPWCIFFVSSLEDLSPHKIGSLDTITLFEKWAFTFLVRSSPPAPTQENSKMAKNDLKIGLLDTNSAADQT